MIRLFVTRTQSFLAVIIDFPQLLFISSYLLALIFFNNILTLSLIVGITFIVIVFLSGKWEWGVLLSCLIGLTVGWGRVQYDLKIERNVIEQWESSVGVIKHYEAKIVEEPKAKSEGYSVIYEISLSDNIDSNSARVIANLPQYPKPHYGEQCSVVGKVKLIENFGEFDYVAYMRNRRIYYSLEIDQISCHTEENRFSFRGTLLNFKGRITSKVERHLHEPSASLMIGILLGDDRVFDESFDDSLRVTGTTHIIAASGYNISLIALGVERLTSRYLKPGARSIITLSCIWSFSIISGLSASVVRASIMATLMIIGIIFNQQRNVHFILPFTIFIFAIYDPRIIYSIGFALSVLSTASLIYISPLLSKSFETLTNIVSEGFVANAFKYILNDLFIPTLSCTVGTLPFLGYTFREISILGVFSNLLVLPVVEFIMIFGLIALGISIFQIGLESFFFNSAAFLLRYFEGVIMELGSWKWGIIDLEFSNMKFLSILSYFLMIIVVVVFYPEGEDNFYFKKYE